MKLDISRGDITTIKIDAIVNAANSSLLGGGGVDGAIHRNGGKAIMEECLTIRSKQGGCKTGEAVITTAGNLPSKYVIHTVGPVWTGGNNNEPELLANCYNNCLKIAVEQGIKTIAFPNISTGIYHFPKRMAAEIALKTIYGFKDIPFFERIVLVCFDEENYGIHKKLQEEWMQQ